LTDGSGTEVFKASYDAWGNRTVSNSTFAFHRGYTGHEHLTEFGLIDMNGRIYDPLLGRFLSPDPYVQMPDFSQNFNRYSYCLNNPLIYTDPSGEWFGLDDLLVAGVSWVYGYVSYGFTTGNWGWKAAGNGLITAGTAWLGYNTMGASLTAGEFLGNMAINNTLNQLMPSTTIPVGEHFSLSLSLGVGWGTNGLIGGLNVTGVYSNEDYSIGAGIGVGNNHWGWSVAATSSDGWGIGYGRTYYSSSEVMGQNFEDQKVGTITAFFNHNSFSISNDMFGDRKDRWRTNAAELTIGMFSIGTYLYTNWGERDSEGADKNVEAPLIGKSKFGAWKNGQVYFAPAWVGYRSKNGNQVTRIGFSHEMVQNLTQNLVHKTIGRAPYFLNYDHLISGGYFYSGYYNPFSLWER
jgi:RHS repeat-associated protein